MACEDIPSLLDLQNTKKRIDHFAELIDGTPSGTSTNPITNKVLPTYEQAIEDLGFKPGSGDFTTGFTVLPGQYDIAWRNPVDNNWYSYLGIIPSGGYTVVPGTNPVGSSLWKPVTDQTLREDLSNDGADIVDHNGLPVARYIGDKIIVRPVGNPAGDKSALLAAANSAAATGMAVHTLKGDVFTIDNSAGTGITFTQDDFQLTGLGRIKATHDTNHLVVTTGKRAKVTHTQFEGPGTYRPELGGTGNPPALLKMTGEDSSVDNPLFLQPYCAGLFVEGVAGGLDKKPVVLCAYSGAITNPFIFGIYYRVCSDRITMGAVVNGCIQGICGGGDGSGAITVTSKDGTVTSNLRNITISMCQAVNQLDHSIYFSNNTENISILNCTGLKSVNELVKLEGGPNNIIGCTGKGGAAISLRNPFKTRISGCDMTTTLNSETSAYAIFVYEKVFKRGLSSIEIDNSRFTHEGGASQGGIYIEAPVWDDQSYQSVMDDIKIHHVTLKGYGNAPEGFQIRVSQRLFSTNPVTGAMGTGVHIDHNYGEAPISTHTTYGIQLDFGIKGGSCVNNHMKGFRSVGIRKLGVQDFNTALNNLEVAAGVTALGGVYERPKDTSLHYNSQNNTYATNKVVGTASRQVWMSDETCYNEDRVILVRTNTGAETILASQCPKQVVYTNVNNGTTISIDNNPNTPWPDKSDLVITNSTASNSLTVNVNGGIAVAAGASLRLVRNSGAWIKA